MLCRHRGDAIRAPGPESSRENAGLGEGSSSNRALVPSRVLLSVQGLGSYRVDILERRGGLGDNMDTSPIENLQELLGETHISRGLWRVREKSGLRLTA